MLRHHSKRPFRRKEASPRLTLARRPAAIIEIFTRVRHPSIHPNLDRPIRLRFAKKIRAYKSREILLPCDKIAEGMEIDDGATLPTPLLSFKEFLFRFIGG